MKHLVHKRAWLLLAAALAATSILSGCGYTPTATVLPPVTVVAQATAAQPSKAEPQPAPSAASEQAPTVQAPAPQPGEPTAYPLPTMASSGATTANTPWSAYPAPTEPASAGSKAALELTILHVNDVYGEIDPCG